MIVYNDCNRKGKVLILLAGFLKRDFLVTFSKISLLAGFLKRDFLVTFSKISLVFFLLQLLVKSFSIIIIIIVIIINIPIINYSFQFIFSFIIIGYFSLYYFTTIYLYIFLLFIFHFLNSFLLHFPTFISSFDLLHVFNFVIPVIPAAFYYNFKYYPYWP